MATKRAISYARKSPSRNADESESVPRQLQGIREYAALHDIEIMDEFSDQALSGADHDRPGLWDAVAALKRGWILIVRDYQRLARDTTLAMIIEQKIKQRGCKLMATENGDLIDRDEDPSMKMLRTIMHAYAEFDRAVRNARTRAGMLRNQRNGRRQSAECPYGWTTDPDSELNEYDRPSGMQPVESEQRAIERMQTLREAGDSYRKICETLTVEGHPPRGANWHPASVRRILNRQ
jgi:site-specific DNA recombinase